MEEMNAAATQPFHLLHGLMSAGKLGEPAFAVLWRATAAACEAQPEEGGGEEEEEEDEGGSTGAPCPPFWTAAEKQALMRHIGQLEAFPGYPFTHGRKTPSPIVHQHLASWNAVCAAVAAECGTALRTVAATYVVAQALRSGRYGTRRR